MLEPGTRLGPYEILAPVGAGGMGEVYKARDTRLDRIVAVKVLPAHLSENPALRERFEREARAISAITHPNICTLYDVGSEDGTTFLVMEYLEGESLADRLGRGGLPIDAVLRYGAEIADALERAHRQGVIHRDLKPANVMITRGGAKLLDFGLARQSPDGAGAISGLTNAATAQRALTAEGQIVGTFQYMAPEQLEGQAADARTDVFALGLLLYEMLTGKRAFDGKTRTSVIAKIVSGEPDPVSEVQPLTPPALERVIRTCLAKDPEDRWQTAHDVKLALKSVSEERSTPAALRARSPRSRARKWLPWIVAAIASVAALGLAVSAARRPERAASTIRFGIAEPPNRRLGAIAVSPDGRRIAAALATLDDKLQVVIRDLSGFDFRPLLTPGPERPHYAWSPDGRSIAFIMNQRLVRVDLASGKPEVISPGGYGVGIAWLENGTIVFSRRFGEGLFAVSATGGEPRALTRLDTGKGETLHGWPAPVPGHPDLVLYLRRTTPSVRSIVRLLDVRSGKSSDIVEADALVGATLQELYYVRSGALLRQAFDPTKAAVSGKAEIVADNLSYIELWADADASIDREGRTIAYNTHVSDRTAFRWVDREGRSLGDLAIASDSVAPRISGDGRWMATMRFEPEHGAPEIWLRDLTRGIESRLTHHPSSDEEPIWSPDGRELIFNTDRFGLYGAAIVPANGSAEARTLVEPIDNSDTWVRDCAPDGTLLLEVSRPETRGDLWVANIKDVRSAKPYLATRASEENAAFSPDGKWIAYNLTAAGGRREVYIVSYPRPDSRFQISTNGGSVPRWSRDGSEVIFESAGSIVAVPIIRRDNVIEPGVPQTLFKLPANTIYGEDGPTIDVSSDGKRLLLPVLVDGRKPRSIHVIAVR